nr:DUF3097 family protein [Pseudoclavibacter endophyticus]
MRTRNDASRDLDDRYAGDPVARMRSGGTPSTPRDVPMARGLFLEDAASGFYGELVGAEADIVRLRDFDGQERAFPRNGLFLLDDEPVRLVAPQRAPTRSGEGGRVAPGRARSASGSFHVAGARARVARAGRIFVEGKHDAELVEKVWGHDLRIEGVVVELLDGADHLDDALRAFGPGPRRRVGVLLDHLVDRSKERRIADAVTAKYGNDALLVLGHPYVDVWQAVRPQRLGLQEWPTIPMGESWKHGILRHLGWPREEQADVARGWQRILGRVRDYRDLEPSVSGRVEELIDFVTAAPQ